MSELREVVTAVKSSPLFDGHWYVGRYADVKLMGVDPAEHYVRFGALMNRDPGPRFSTRAYLDTHEDVRRTGINPLFHYLKWGMSEGRNLNLENPPSVIEPILDGQRGKQDGRGAQTDRNNELVFDAPEGGGLSALELGARLWGGFSRYALPALEKLKGDRSKNAEERIQAAWQLMRWYYVEEDHLRVCQNASLARALSDAPQKKIELAEIQSLIAMGHFAHAHETLCRAEEVLGPHRDFYLLRSTIVGNMGADHVEGFSGEAGRLYWLNRVYESARLAPLQKLRPGAPLSISNITAQAETSVEDQSSKVSVIIPAYNGEDTIHIALESLRRQTWRNIEVVVVDDCSTDGTADVVEDFVTQDDRFKLIRKPINEGAYPARNTALRYVTGDYIMVHDCDDWSHPQKIEAQINTLKTKPECVAVMSRWIRVQENLDVVGSWRPTGNLSDLNFSSLMFERKVFDKLGGWDSSRVSGDSEYKSRIEALYGEAAIARTSRSSILSLALAREDSLTRTKATHARTLDYGLRWTYRDAYRFWHRKKQFSEDPRMDPDSKPFPPVLRNMPSAATCEYDAVFVADFSQPELGINDALEVMKKAAASCGRIGTVHWPRYHAEMGRSLSESFYELALTHDIHLITPGDAVKSDLLLLCDVSLLEYEPDTLPRIDATRVVAEVLPSLGSMNALCGLCPDLPDMEISSLFELFES